VPRVNQHEQIFLGDVIISKTVSQYDFGWHYSDKFVRKDTVEDNLGRANKDIRSLITVFETDRGLDQLEQRTAYYLQQLQSNAARRRRQGKYDYPGTAEDKLFEPTYRHKHHKSPICICHHCVKDSDPVCDKALSLSCTDLGCDDEQRIARKRSHDSNGDIPQPAVHVGAVASGDKVMKSAAERDKLSREAGVIAFETEGAGVWDEVPCIVVKGVCNYADSHNRPGWQNFAAAAAASASRAILERYIQTDKF
jgi:nucleoside phosphorylase